MEKEQDTRAVHLPTTLYDRIQERMAAAGFKTVDEYVVFVLEQVIKERRRAGKNSRQSARRKSRR